MNRKKTLGILQHTVFAASIAALFCTVSCALPQQPDQNREQSEEMTWQDTEQPEPKEEYDDFYVQSLQNLHMGNSMVYKDGYYYFRSQTMNYSLCRSKGAGMMAEEIADQIPGAIYVEGDQVYFLNVSDGRRLYQVGADGTGLKKVSDFPMQEMIVIGDTVYFRSVYEREFDPFYQLLEEAAEDDRYLYSMKLDGTGCRLLVPEVCLDFSADKEHIYYWICTDQGKYELYRNNLSGTEEENLFESETMALCTLPYEGDLYWIDWAKDHLVKLDSEGNQEILADNAACFTISGKKAYVVNEQEIRILDLDTKTKLGLIPNQEKQADSHTAGYSIPWYDGAYNKGIFAVNGQIFARYFEDETKGVLWHIWNEERNAFDVFEDMEPLKTDDLVLDTSLLYELNFYLPGKTDEEADKYVDTDLYYEEYYGRTEDGREYGEFVCSLPHFYEDLPWGGIVSEYMEKLMELTLEDRDFLFEEIREAESRTGERQGENWYLKHGYNHLYVGEQYLSLCYYRRGYSGGIREWMNAMPLIFSTETGERLLPEDLFTVEESRVKKRLTGAVYKYCEMTGIELWNESFDNNVLVKNLREPYCYLTPDGLVLCYDRYAVATGAWGNPSFEIPYGWVEEIACWVPRDKE